MQAIAVSTINNNHHPCAEKARGQGKLIIVSMTIRPLTRSLGTCVAQPNTHQPKDETSGNPQTAAYANRFSFKAALMVKRVT